MQPVGVGKALARRPSRRSCGIDGIPDITLKRAGDVIFWFLAVLFNHCTNVGFYPSAWKEALMAPIRKPGADHNRCGSYRPISLLSAFGRLWTTF